MRHSCQHQARVQAWTKRHASGLVTEQTQLQQQVTLLEGQASTTAAELQKYVLVHAEATNRLVNTDRSHAAGASYLWPQPPSRLKESMCFISCSLYNSKLRSSDESWMSCPQVWPSWHEAAFISETHRTHSHVAACLLQSAPVPPAAQPASCIAQLRPWLPSCLLFAHTCASLAGIGRRVAAVALPPLCLLGPSLGHRLDFQADTGAAEQRAACRCLEGHQCAQILFIGCRVGNALFKGDCGASCVQSLHTPGAIRRSAEACNWNLAALTAKVTLEPGGGC